MKKKIFFLSTILSVLPFLASADEAPTSVIKEIFTRFTDYIVWPIFNGVVIIMFLYAGFKYLTAKGDPSKVEEANKAILWAVVGVAVALLVDFATGIIKSIILG